MPQAKLKSREQATHCRLAWKDTRTEKTSYDQWKPMTEEVYLGYAVEEKNKETPKRYDFFIDYQYE